jgi:hypothetical protein
MHEEFTRGRQPFQHDDVNIRRRAESEKKEPDILRMLAQDYKRSQRAQSLPPDFRIAEYKTQNKAVQTDNKTQQDRAVQTDENPELEQRAQSVIADLRKRVLPTQSRDAQTDITYHAQDYEKDYETLEQRTQVLRGHFLSDTADGGTSSTPPPDFLPWRLETIDQTIAKQETSLAAAQDDLIQNFTKKAETSSSYEEYLKQFQGNINAQREARTAFNQRLQDLKNHFDPNSPQWQMNIKYINALLHDYQRAIVGKEEALACAALKKPRLTPDAEHNAIHKAHKRMKPLTSAIGTLRREPNEANLLMVVDEWEAFSEAEIARNQPITTFNAKW